ncbi:MAG: hypothetical protein HC796_08020 [Synechococcaceae cyanobacterium RL_1_2]|nr:hypothetical protein [Synechococcaceae cyanobacterium RL_1_2]
MEFDLIQTIKECVYALAMEAQGKNLEFTVDIVNIHQKIVKGDPFRFRQIILNLVGNAIKFTEVGAILMLCKLAPAEQDGTLVFSCSIKDTGIGIPVDKIPILFESFTQVDASNTRKYGGTGLGLAITRRLCELMGGQIFVESNLGQGSCFTFTTEFQSSDATFLGFPCHDLSGTRFLVVDRNIASRDLLVRHLSKWGGDVQWVGHGVGALALIQTELTKGHTIDGIFISNNLKSPPSSGIGQKTSRPSSFAPYSSNLFG